MAIATRKSTFGEVLDRSEALFAVDAYHPVLPDVADHAGLLVENETRNVVTYPDEGQQWFLGSVPLFLTLED